MKMGKAALKFCQTHVVRVEIDVTDMVLFEHVIKTGRGQQILIVTPVSRPFGHDHFASAQSLERIDRRLDYRGMGIYCTLRIKLDEIGLKQHALAVKLQTKHLDTSTDRVAQRTAVLFRCEDRHLRTLGFDESFFFPANLLLARV